MAKVSIIYFSGFGHTAKLAEAVHKGATSVAGVTSELIAIGGDDIIKGRYQNDAVMAKLDASDAIIFGSSTYMGGVAAQFKAFADASSTKWFTGAWRDKLASGFTVSSSPSGDKLHTLDYFFRLAMQHGMIWVGLGEMPMQENGINRLGSFSGAMGQARQEPPDVAPNEADKMTGEALGKRTAHFALRLKS
ncbi:MAG TPA: flavodoxin family protein [Verrucomicrobiae bacterium]|nr:flavodoxin family protein [Verrucomicrobiae bacterium]